jgi:hypothetical protein
VDKSAGLRNQKSEVQILSGAPNFQGKTMTARNDITGDSIVNSKGDKNKYAENWEKIFGNKNKDKQENKTEHTKENKDADK